MDPASWDERYAASDRVWSAEPNVFVVAELSELPAGRALDLAGGEGRHAVWLAQRGWQVELVDFSRVALERAAATAAAAGVVVRCTHADVCDPPPLVPADLVLIAYLQLDRTSWQAAIRHAAGLLAPGGTLFVIAHARRNVTDGYGGPSDPQVQRTVEEVVADLAGTGVVVVDAREVTRTVPGAPRPAIDLLVRATRPGPEVGAG